jgi:hypothetical protein
VTYHPLTAYKGKENYIFVSYAHKDGSVVFPIMEELANRGYRIWYDEGIVPGSEWPEDIAQHLSGSAVVIAFVTPNSMASVNCRREINYALAKGKPLLSVVLEPTEMPPGMELQLSTQQSVLRYQCDTEEKFLEKICAYPAMGCCGPNTADPEIVEVSEPARTVTTPPLREDEALLRRQQIRERVTLYGELTASVASGLGAVILIAVTLLLFANYHWDNLVNYASVGPLPDRLADFVAGVWHGLPELTSPAYRRLENLPAIAWLIAVAWFLKNIGHTFYRRQAAKTLSGVASLVRFGVILGHFILCGMAEIAQQQGEPNWEIWAEYYLPVENLVVFAGMLLAGIVVGRIVNLLIRKVLNLTCKTEL